MSTVNLDNRLNNPLLHLLHAVKLFIQNPPCLLRINSFEIVAFPLNIHHNRKRSLGMAPLFRGHFMRAGNCQIPSCPETDIIRQGSSRAGYKIRNALNTGQLHAVAGLFLILIRDLFRRSVTGEKPLNHKLQKTVLGRKLHTASEGNLPDLIHGIAVLPHSSGKAHIDMVFPQPFQKTDKPGVNPQNIFAEIFLSVFKLESSPPDGICKHTVGMMFQTPRAVSENQNRMRGRRL